MIELDGKEVGYITGNLGRYREMRDRIGAVVIKSEPASRLDWALIGAALIRNAANAFACSRLPEPHTSETYNAEADRIERLFWRLIMRHCAPIAPEAPETVKPCSQNSASS